VLNIAYNLLAGGQCLEDLELLRNDEVYLDALGTQRIPDPTTAGDFCRRFRAPDIEALFAAIHAARRRVWVQQTEAFFEKAVLDVDGTLVPTTGECKEGMDIAYDGTWGFHPLIVSLSLEHARAAVHREPQREPTVARERSGANRSSGARVPSSGLSPRARSSDTDFTQTKHLDRWNEEGMEFVFGIDAMPNLVALASQLESRAWKRLKRAPTYERVGPERARPPQVKEQIVRDRGFKNLRRISEDVTDVTYRPTACRQEYRLVIVQESVGGARRTRALRGCAVLLLPDERLELHGGAGSCSMRTTAAIRRT
jgi:hypothetical protein